VQKFKENLRRQRVIPSFWRLKFSFAYGSDNEGGGGDEGDDEDDNHYDKVTGMHYQNACAFVQGMCLKNVTTYCVYH
jgi:hypothetical protein